MPPSLRSLLAIASLFCAGLNPLSAESPALDRPTIVCTVGMVADVARSVAGDRADVSSLIGPGVDPHLYKPTRSDIGRLLQADLVVAVGGRLGLAVGIGGEPFHRTGHPPSHRHHHYS